MQQLEINNHITHISPSLPIFESFNVKCDHSYSQDSSQIDQDKCYLMEIQQLKRQNNFLKKKLGEFTKRQHLGLPIPATKRQSSHFGNSPQQVSEDSTQNYILVFIEEVTKLLENFSNLFKIDVESNLLKQFQSHNKLLNELTKQNSDQLNRRLSRILFEPEENKYRTLIEIFQNFYRQTTQNRKILRQKVQEMASQAIEIGKKMADRVKQKQKARGSIKGSRIFPVSKESEQSKEVGQDCLRSSIIKSTCTESLYQLSSVRMSLGKQKLFYNLF